MTQVVITQPMLFPWVGLFEQLKLADVCIFYDNTAFSKGSFTNRVQIPVAAHAHKWLTLPLTKFSLGTEIRDLVLRPEAEWKPRHLAFLAQVYDKAPFKEDMLNLVEEVYAGPQHQAMHTIVKSMQAVCRYYDIAPIFKYASELAVDTSDGKSEKVLEMVKACEGSTYITGHGALKYLDHSLFEASNIRVHYMDYAKRAYPQVSTSVFNPYVSTLDLIANLGPEGKEIFCPKTLDWKEIDHAS